jgi:hypothetical protein
VRHESVQVPQTEQGWQSCLKRGTRPCPLPKLADLTRLGKQDTVSPESAPFCIRFSQLAWLSPEEVACYDTGHYET